VVSPPMRSDPLGEFLTRTLAEQPDPPRRMTTRAVLGVLLHVPGPRTLAIVGIAALVIGLLCATREIPPGIPFSKSTPALSVVTLPVGVMLLAVVLIAARRLRNNVRSGQRMECEVLRVHYSKPFYPTTWDSSINGQAVGCWRTEYPAGLQEHLFTNDRPWARLIIPGSRIEVLCDPIQQIVFVSIRLLG